MIVYFKNHPELVNTVLGQNPELQLSFRGAYSAMDANCTLDVFTHSLELVHGRITYVTAFMK